MKLYLNILFLALAILVAACSGKEEEHTAENTEYTCPMHPQIVQNEPGTCPICNMELVPKSAHGEQIEITEDLAFLLRPTNSSVIAAVETTRPQEKTVEATVEMEGIITYDPRRVFTIPARIAGRIEKLAVKYNFQPVSKGQKLLEIYSPELITAQKELLYLVQSAPEDKQLIEAARQKLRFLGATEAQISRLIRTGEASYTFAIYSPYNGYVIGLNTSAPAAAPAPVNTTSSGSGSGMGSMESGSGAGTGASVTQATATGQDIQLREGMYVNTGQALLRIVNPDQLWAEFNIPAGELSAVAKGAKVQITFPQFPGEKLEGKVDFFQPFYQAGENFAKVRVYLPGSQKLAKVGQLVSATVNYTTAPALWVPKTALLQTGTRFVAFKKVNGFFEPVAVSAGTTAGDQTQVLEGLKQNDVIAANAQFLVDSESFIKIDN